MIHIFFTSFDTYFFYDKIALKNVKMLMKFMIQSSSIVTVEQSTSNADIGDNLNDDGVNSINTEDNDDYEDYDYENKFLFPFSTGSFGPQDGFTESTGT